MARIVANNIPDEIHEDLRCACIKDKQTLEEWVLAAAKEKIVKYKERMKKELAPASNLQ